MSAVLERVRPPVVARARRIVRSWYETLQGPYTSVVLTDGVGFQVVPVSERVAYAIAAVYSALGVYGDLVGTMPVRRYRGESEQLPLPAFVERPGGPEVGWTDEIGQILASLLLRGNAYALPTSWDAEGYPTTFTVLDPSRVAITFDNVDGVPIYRYRFDANRADLVLVNPGPLELLHLRWQRPPGSFVGIGILDANAYPGGALQTAWATSQYAGELMANPVPPAVLTHPMRLNKQQAADLQTQWAESVGRARAVPAVLSGGITYTPLTVSARDVQLIESRRWDATEIATLFRLPPYMLGGSTGDSLTYSTVEGENTRLWTTALMPMTVRVERAFGAWVPRGQRLRFVPDVLLRSQTLDRYQAHKIGLDAGFETTDEVRALENRPPLPATPEPEPSADGSEEP